MTDSDARLPARVLVVVRDRASAVDLAPLLAGSPIALEITSSIDGYVDLIEELSTDHPGLRVIAGTIVEAESARAAVAAGAEAIVSPHVVPELPAAVEVPTIIGALTPTEVVAAAAAGATAVKVFPVSAAGGASYLRALRAPYPSIPLVPSGGIKLDQVPDYFAAGAEAVAMGSGSLPAGAIADLVGILEPGQV